MEISKAGDENAVMMTYNEASNFQWDLVKEWKPYTDVWAFKAGTWVLGGASGICGFIINMHYRNKLKLGKYGHFSTYMPLTILPTIFGSFYHRMVISTNILVEKDICPVCIETRGVVIQNMCGVVYPFILAPIANYMLANMYSTVRIPVMHMETKKLWEFHKTVSKGLYKKLPYMIIGNTILATFIIHCEFRNFAHINEEIRKIEMKMKRRDVTKEQDII